MKALIKLELDGKTHNCCISKFINIKIPGLYYIQLVNIEI